MATALPKRFPGSGEAIDPPALPVNLAYGVAAIALNGYLLDDACVLGWAHVLAWHSDQDVESALAVVERVREHLTKPVTRLG